MSFKIIGTVDYPGMVINPAKLIEVANHLAEVNGGDAKQNILVDAVITQIENDEGATIYSFGLKLAQNAIVSEDKAVVESNESTKVEDTPQ